MIDMIGPNDIAWQVFINSGILSALFKEFDKGKEQWWQQILTYYKSIKENPNPAHTKKPYYFQTKQPDPDWSIITRTKIFTPLQRDKEDTLTNDLNGRHLRMYTTYNTYPQYTPWTKTLHVQWKTLQPWTTT